MKTVCKACSVIVIALIFGSMMGLLSIVTADPGDFGNWPLTINNGLWTDQNIYTQWSGPLVADLDPTSENGKEVIVAECDQISVYTNTRTAKWNGNPVVYTLNQPDSDQDYDEGYRIKGIPAVGDVNGGSSGI